MTTSPANSTRISKRFAELRESGELGIVAYITAGDPTLDATHKFALTLADLPALLRRVHRFTDLPIAVGFGISLPGHVSILGGLAGAAVIGSALVSEIEKAPTPDAAAAALRERMQAFKEAARHGLSRREALP
jgi:tryptophan synthase alpha subunit